MFISSFICNGSVGLSYVCKWAFFTRELIDYIRGMFSSPGSGQEQRLNAKGSNYRVFGGVGGCGVIFDKEISVSRFTID